MKYTVALHFPYPFFFSFVFLSVYIYIYIYVCIFFFQHLKRIIITSSKDRSSKDRNLLSRGNNRVRDSSVRS